MSLGSSINAILEADVNVVAAATGGIFPLRARQGAVAPYLVYRIEDTMPHDDKDGVSSVDHFFVVIEAYAKTYLAVDTLSDLVRTALDRTSGTYDTIVVNSIQFQNKEDLFVDDAGVHLQEQDFKVRINN
tara:strand:- start:91 stop:480 length:390 start_codon:yes stop_codon:yes gene_type:complete